MTSPLFEPRPIQAEIAADNARFKALVLHRRAGKSVFSVNFLNDLAESEPGSRCLFVSGFKSQSKANVWSYVKEFTSHIEEIKYRHGELSVEYPNGSSLELLGASAGWYDIHRGRKAHRIVLDEAAQIEPDAWRSVFRPMLSDTGGDALIVGTPDAEGDFLHECFMRGENHEPGWSSWRRNARETGIIPDDELDALERELPEHVWQREFMCRFDWPSPGAYFAQQMKAARIGATFDPDYPVVTSWFLPDDDSITIIFWQVKDHRRKKELHIIETWRDQITTIEKACSYVKSRPYDYERHLCSSKAADHLPSTRIGEAKKMGVSLRPAPQIPLIDQIHKTKATIPQMVFPAEDRRIHSALKLYHAEYDEDRQVFVGQPVFDWTHQYAQAVAAFVTGYNLNRSDWSEPLPIGGTLAHNAA